ncbi:MAG: hypothetical protein GY856_14090 [bacterium]|nr:hypothetical protein [bacterium]
MNNAAWAGHRQPHDEAYALPEVATGKSRDFTALSILTKQELDTFTDDHDIAACTNVFRLLDAHIDERGFENIAVPLRYLYVKLVIALGTPVINDSTVFAHLAKKDRDALTHLFDGRPETPAPTFSDVATFILGAAIEREGFAGFSGFERLEGSGRILMIASHREEQRVDQFFAPPAGLHRMASFLRVFGFEVHVVDPELDGVTKLELLASTVTYDAVMVSILQPTMVQMIKCMDRLQRCAGTRDALFIGGGQGATTSNRNFLLQEIPLDLICARLGEFPTLNCMVQLQDGEVHDIEKYRASIPSPLSMASRSHL